jgi:hypothetical protein
METVPAPQGPPPVGKHPTGGPEQPWSDGVRVDLINPSPGNGKDFGDHIVGIAPSDPAGAIGEHIVVVVLEDLVEPLIGSGRIHSSSGL